jgi:hypothetical protein
VGLASSAAEAEAELRRSVVEIDSACNQLMMMLLLLEKDDGK